MEWSIGHSIYKRAIFTPDKAAVIYEDKPISYKELNDNVNRTANYLLDKGIKKGDRITALFLNCPEFLEVYFAAAKIGAIFVPINFRLVGPEIEYQLNNCESCMFIFHDLFVPAIDPIRSNVMVDRDKYIYVKGLNPGGPECPEWAQDYSEVVANYSTEEPNVVEDVDLDDPLAIIYTSGTTGDPKGAVVSHLQTFFKNIQIMMYMDMNSKDIFLAQLPLFHSGGLFVVATPVLWRGATMILRYTFDPGQFATDIEKHRPTCILALTTMWRFILDSGKLDKIDVSSVRHVGGGGEATPQTLLDELAKRGLYVQQGFGQTENSAMMMVPKEMMQKKQGSIGLPGFCTEVWVADDEFNKLPPGKVGRIVCKGPTRMIGYWKMPEKTKEAIKGNILDTGDLGYTDEDGFFYMVDRAKDMYRSGGENVYPAEIEKILAAHPKITNAVIIGVPDDKWGETGKVFVLPAKEGETITLDEIHTFLEGKAARYKFPKILEMLTELPMTATGKIRKTVLKEKEKAKKSRENK